MALRLALKKNSSANTSTRAGGGATACGGMATGTNIDFDPIDAFRPGREPLV